MKKTQGVQKHPVLGSVVVIKSVQLHLNHVPKKSTTGQMSRKRLDDDDFLVDAETVKYT